MNSKLPADVLFASVFLLLVCKIERPGMAGPSGLFALLNDSAGTEHSRRQVICLQTDSVNLPFIIQFSESMATDSVKVPAAVGNSRK